MILEDDHPIFQACKTGDYETVSKHLSEGISVYAEREWGREPITENVHVIWDDLAKIFGSFGKNFGHKTDIEVTTGVYPDLISRQFKSTAAAMKSPTKVRAWCEKARKARLIDVGDYSGMEFHPPGEISKIAKTVKHGWTLTVSRSLYFLKNS